MTAGATDQWLVECEPEDYERYRRSVLDALGALAKATTEAHERASEKARDAVVWLDHELRTLVPVRRTETGVELIPPAARSAWAEVLQASFDVVRMVCSKTQPAYEVGLPPLGILITEAVKVEHVQKQQSYRQRGTPYGHIVWILAAWTEQRTNGGALSVQSHARVVYLSR